MNAVERTKQMMVDWDKKVKLELANLEEGFEKKDFLMVTKAAKVLHSFGNRGFDLAMEGKDYVRFTSYTRREFFEMMMPEFKFANIEVLLPVSGNGEAIYFKILGERVGVLYGEHQSIHSEGLYHDNCEEYYNKKVAYYKNFMDREEEEIQKLQLEIQEFEDFIENPAVIHTEKYKEYRLGGNSPIFFGRNTFTNFMTLQENKFLGKVYAKFSGKKIEKVLHRPETVDRMKNLLAISKECLENAEKSYEHYEECYIKLNESKVTFLRRLKALQEILKKYNIPVNPK